MSQGQNDSANIVSAVQGWLPGARAKVGAAPRIVLFVPIAGTHASELQSAVSGYITSSSDARVNRLTSFADNSAAILSGSSDGVHPLTAGHALMASSGSNAILALEPTLIQNNRHRSVHLGPLPTGGGGVQNTDTTQGTVGGNGQISAG